jgi:hypothetical protein
VCLSRPALPSTTAVLELVLLTCLREPITGRHLFFDASRTGLAFELPSGTATLNLPRWAALSLLPAHRAVPCASTFESSRNALEQGMGAAFHRRVEGGGDSAFDRLHYVSHALMMHARDRGCFPHDYHGPPPEMPIMTGEECFTLLTRAARLTTTTTTKGTSGGGGGGEPSLCCLWSFVSVMYWQLRGLEHPASPLKCALMPDVNPAAPRDDVIKAKLKGEVRHSP